MATMTIGVVSVRTGVSRDTIRYYERLGLLPRPPRTPSGYRLYSDGAIRRLALIRNAQRFGFPLREIAGFLRVRDGGGKPCQQVRAAGERLLQAVDAQIADLRTLRRRMQQTLRDWDAALERAGNQPARLLEQLGDSNLVGRQ